MKDILTVSELTAHIKTLLEASFDTLWVAGEISNLRRPASGHVYCTLKDKESQIRAVIFRHALQRIGFDLEDGMEIVCRGKINVYQVRGEYQLIIDAAEPRGYGALQLAFEQLKKKLDEEGLFDPAGKREIPFLPRRIGIVTSSTGAAIRDILQITGRRFPSIDILIAPVRVQGVEAPPEICEAIEGLQGQPDIDVIIVTRGGGSLEDLFPFNNEGVARAIHASSIPVISAVGHEIDFTIADFVADLRAPTPSAAAELVVPNRRDLRERIEHLHARTLRNQRNRGGLLSERLVSLQTRLKDPRRQAADLRLRLDDMHRLLTEGMTRGLDNRRDGLDTTSKLLMLMHPNKKTAEHRRDVTRLQESLTMQTGRILGELRHGVTHATTMLNNLNPLSVLERGYAIVRRVPDNTLVRDVEALTAGSEVSVRVSSGGFMAEVTKITEE